MRLGRVRRSSSHQRLTPTTGSSASMAIQAVCSAAMSALRPRPTCSNRSRSSSSNATYTELETAPRFRSVSHPTDPNRWLELTYPLDWRTDLVEIIDLVATADDRSSTSIGCSPARRRSVGRRELALAKDLPSRRPTSAGATQRETGELDLDAPGPVRSVQIVNGIPLRRDSASARVVLHGAQETRSWNERARSITVSFWAS